MASRVISILIVPLCLVAHFVQPKEVPKMALNKDMIDRVNSLKISWKAAENRFFKELSIEDAKKLMGVRRDKQPGLKVYRPYDSSSSAYIPKHFDARTNWPHCPSIRQIRDQSNCGACWAMAATEAISDRICIATNGRETPTISTVDLLSCCQSCGPGCDSGYPEDAWIYWVRHGLVSGGLYGSNEGCKPYPFPPCSHHVEGRYPACTGDYYAPPECKKQCDGAANSTSYLANKYYGRSAYIVGTGEKSIQLELMYKGPLEAGIRVYEDFLIYKKGIYQHTNGSPIGYHATRLLGWGVEAGIPYWLLANSWNEDWGENGYFRVLRNDTKVFMMDECTGGEYLNRQRH